MVNNKQLNRRKLLRNTAIAGGASVSASGVTAGSTDESDRSDEYTQEHAESTLFEISDGEVRVKPDHVGSPLERSAERINDLFSDDTIMIEGTYEGEFDISHLSGLEQIAEDDGVGAMHHGENSFSGDRSTWGTPYQTHRVKFDSDLSEEISYALGEMGDYATILAIVVGVSGIAYAQKVAAFAAACALYLHNRSRRFDHYNNGHGVDFRFRWAEVPTNSTCGAIIPGGTCDDISWGPFDGPVVFYDSDYGSQ
ncbi:hypothetical protein Halru_2663 [Halovivax ruber XH-70]|uniref:Uncharacterized protein n=1 Tax=Halovivax ruber (strain DSM 18193 / JCM 13892 / XH-70) TaxID=797302 RepID=L0IEP1_HALRX|nr:hypothetical protein [Halovivax ruber]AGB17239.1 hypothetical protein Halru_2663 [Halovivax ruber XH-70]